MTFLTEDDIRSRCTQSGSTLHLGPGERLTPSAAEYVNQMRLKLVQGDCPEVASPSCAPCSAPQCTEQGYTRLDNETVVPKSHPAIALRGKLDSLLATTILVQTQFDPKNRLPHFLKDCLADLHEWVMAILTAEIGGTTPAIKGMGGMDMPTLHQVSQDPQTYLGIGHFMAEVSLGGNIALLNWLRALIRENEVAAVCCACPTAQLEALNRLSSAVYVLMLLTLAAEKGIDISQAGTRK